ncbi:tetratricopeptide repeat protein [Mucilaginibacter gracilis]|uniref:Tetratricopeptide repeat protein n=1 Tax=Mucilaginibacter gracilis TaxID=423350 RepID=A0A495J1Y7_9SPHI|nr:tetratricopeptide repeat protein [Mucilaginibacter gracilis]RKR82314.1 tetratricopeptide repeat protein [Mucilaginibacter gracilis]
MKRLHKLLFIIALIIHYSVSAKAQNNNTATELIKQGVALNNEGKYAEAIDKFNEVLKNDSENEYANYQIAFSLFTFKKPKEAIPHIEKAIKSNNATLSAAAYCLLATIYDDDHLAQKAIETYNAAIKIKPDYPQIYYNLAISYFRNKQYAEAESSIIEAIKHNPQQATNHRLYALVTFHQNKRVNALLGFCSFLLLEPTGSRAIEAYGNIQHIMQGGVLKDDKGNTILPVSDNNGKETDALNSGISMAVASGKAKKLSGLELFEYELKAIFSLAGQLSEKKTDKLFFDKFFADYFYNLAQSTNMQAFTHTITLTDSKIDNAKWRKENTGQTNAMAEWLKNTQRVY